MRAETRVGTWRWSGRLLFLIGILGVTTVACSRRQSPDETDVDPVMETGTVTGTVTGANSNPGDGADATSGARPAVDAPPALDPSVLSGWLLAVTASPAGVSNRSNRFEIADGQRETLWVTADGANVTDWSLAPDRSRVAYRVIQRAPGEPAIADEQLVTRGLEADDPAYVVASTDTATARLAGFAWSPDGSSLAFGKQVGGLPGADVEARGQAPVWELWAGAASAEGGPMVTDRLLWRAEADILGSNPLTLLTWDPDSGRAAILEQAADSGVAMSIWLIDTRSGELAERIETDGQPIGWAETAASPNGQQLLLAETGETRAHLHWIGLLDGDRQDLPLGDRLQATSLRWDGLGEQAAWTQKPLGPSSGEIDAERENLAIIVTDFAGHGGAKTFTTRGQESSALAFSPDGRFLLVGERDDAFDLGWSRLAVYEIATGARNTLDWTLPADTWAVFWTESSVE